MLCAADKPCGENSFCDLLAPHDHTSTLGICEDCPDTEDMCQQYNSDACYNCFQSGTYRDFEVKRINKTRTTDELIIVFFQSR